MKRYLPFVIIVAVALLTVGAGGMLYRAKRHAPLAAGAAPTSVAKIDEKMAHVRGGPNAPVTIEEFGDFQCPSCSGVADLLHKLEQDYRPRLRIVFRHFPLKMHSHALEAAIAAEAAGSQGRFWEMHDLLYQYQMAWSEAANVQPLFENYAGNLGLDVERFKKDLTTREVNSRVASDMELGVSGGVKNTPTLFINGREMPVPFTRETVREAIEAAITANKSSHP
jgi:protein-disulfide isomerase